MIEIAMVLAILAILSAVSIPQYQKFLQKSQRADAFITLNAVHKHELSYFLNEDTFAIGLANDVNARLGMGMGQETRGGYFFTDYMPYYSPTGEAIGYHVALSKNLDQDPAQDIYVMKYKTSPATPQSDGTPLFSQDDITNRVCVEICYPF